MSVLSFAGLPNRPALSREQGDACQRVSNLESVRGKPCSGSPAGDRQVSREQLVSICMIGVKGALDSVACHSGADMSV